MKRSPRFTQGFTRTLNPKFERFIRVKPTAVELIRKKPSLGPQKGKWLKRASFIHPTCTSTIRYVRLDNFHRGGGVTPHARAWPLQDIVLLQGSCARINHPCTPPRPPALPTLVQNLCTNIGKYMTLLRSPLCMLYTMQYW